MNNTNDNIKQYYSLTKASVNKREKLGVYIVDYRLKDLEGNVTHSSRRFKQLKDAKAFANQIMIEHAEAIAAREAALTENNESNMLFSELYRRYLDYRTGDKKSTVYNREKLISRHILPVFGDMRINEIKPDTVARWKSCLYDDNGKKIYSDTYMRSLHSRLSAILNYAVLNDWLPQNPAKRIKMGKKNSDTEKPIWTPKQYALFMEQITDNPVAYMAFEVLFKTGLRRGELLALKVSDYDPLNKELDVNECLQIIGGEEVVDTPKTQQSIRKVKLPDSLCADLNDYIQAMPVATPNTRLFPIGPYALRYELKKGTERANLPPISIHCFRHSHISYLVSLGFNPVEIALRVGHEKTNMTLHYSHAYNDSGERIANAIERMEESNNAEEL